MSAAPILRRVPGAPRLRVHPDAGRGARRLRSLAGASDWRRGLLDAAGAATITLAGPDRLPPADRDWDWPDVGAEELVDLLTEALPRLRLLGAVVPRQTGRERLSVLGAIGPTTAVIKLGRSEPGASMRVEADVLELLTHDPLPGIATPHLLAAGEVQSSAGPIEFVATTSIGLGAQRPAFDVPLRTFERDLTARLTNLPVTASSSDRVVTDADGLVAVHGDLTPWNLRWTARGLALFDWEAAGRGRPGSDLALYRRTCDEVRPWWRRRGRPSG